MLWARFLCFPFYGRPKKGRVRIEPPTDGFSDLGRGSVRHPSPRERGAEKGSEVGGGSLYPSLDMGDSSAPRGSAAGRRFPDDLEQQAIQQVPYNTAEDR